MDGRAINELSRMNCLLRRQMKIVCCRVQSTSLALLVAHECCEQDVRHVPQAGVTAAAMIDHRIAGIIAIAQQRGSHSAWRGAGSECRRCA